MATRKAEPGQERPVKMGDLLLARVAPEDASGYRPEMLARAAELAEEAVYGHHRDESIVRIDRDCGVERHGRPVTLITVVNDNRPFLFDSVMGAVTNIAGEALLVAHPVLVVRHGADGVEEVLGDGGIAREAGADRLSVIHVHVRALTDDEADALAGQLAHVLAQVRAATSEWRPMLARLDHAISDFRYAPIALDQEAVTEAIAFLEWLRDDNFTFLGMREFTYSDGALERAEKRGIGILADPDVRVLRREGNEDGTSTPEIRAFLHGPEPLIVTKANARSVVHRRAYLDYVGVKTFHADGSLAGELRIVGLFTSTAYTRSVMRIPYLRSKAQAVIRKLGFNPADHNGKALINVLESYPRDELFQVPVPVLRKHAEAILALVERPRVRALVRIDQFDRFVSVLTYVPRDRYDSIVREKIGAHLKTVFEGRLSAYYPAFPEGSLARVHFIIGRSGGKTPKVDPAAIEAAIRDIIRTWEDGLRDEAAALGFDETLAATAARFPESYRGSFSAREALADAARIADLTQENPIALDFYRHASDASKQASLKIYHHAAPVPLSRRVPMLENIGFRVISERTFEVVNSGGAAVFIHDMELESGFGRPLDLADGGKLFEEIVLCVWRGVSENDRYNALAHTAGLHSRPIAVLRAYGRYLQQAGIRNLRVLLARRRRASCAPARWRVAGSAGPTGCRRTTAPKCSAW
jgi:glutamate dehydrogenase